MMPLKTYLKYFFFILKNWGISLAAFTLYHEIRGEKKYGIKTTGFNNLSKLKVESANKRSAFIYQPVNYYMAEKAFGYLTSLNPEGYLVDFGSGKGRIMTIAAHFGFKKITGVEFAPELCKAAAPNMESAMEQFPDAELNVLCMDAAIYPVKDADSIFIFFNPFDGRVMLEVVKNILKSLRTHPREVFVVYFNPTEKEIFLSAGFSEIWYFEKMAYLDVCILYREKEDY